MEKTDAEAEHKSLAGFTLIMAGLLLMIIAAMAVFFKAPYESGAVAAPVIIATFGALVFTGGIREMVAASRLINAGDADDMKQ